MKIFSRLSAALVCLATAGGCAAVAEDKPLQSITGSPMQGTSFLKFTLSGIPADSDLNAYFAPGASVQSPLLVVVQGSGCNSVFALGPDGRARGTAGQDIISTLADGRYNILIVDKPHVQTGVLQAGGEQNDCSLAFRRDHTLENWAAVLSASIDWINPRDLSDTQRIRVLGLSEGALVAARLSAVRSDISHVAFISSFGCHQIDDMLVTVRRNWLTDHPEAAGDKLQDGVAQALAEAEEEFKTVFENPDDHTSIVFGQTPKFWSTFGLACPAQDLLETEADVFVAYGTSDEQIVADGIEEIITRRLVAGRDTHAVRIIGGNHVLQTPAEEQPFQNLIGVFRKALDWMQDSPDG